MTLVNLSEPEDLLCSSEALLSLKAFHDEAEFLQAPSDSILAVADAAYINLSMSEKTCKYLLLFRCDSLFDGLREAFLTRCGHPNGIASLPCVYEKLKHHDAFSSLSAQRAKELNGFMNHVLAGFGNIQIQDECPLHFEAKLWPVVRKCIVSNIVDEQYYLSADELLVICELAKVKVMITQLSDQDLIYIGLSQQNSSNSPTVVMLDCGRGMRGHFSRCVEQNLYELHSCAVRSSEADSRSSSSKANVNNTSEQEGKKNDASKNLSKASDQKNDHEATDHPDKEADKKDDESMASDEESELSDDFDLVDLRRMTNMTWRTLEDQDLMIADAIKQKLRSCPLCPPDLDDPNASWNGMESGMDLPDVHCAFRGCPWTNTFDNIEGNDKAKCQSLEEHLESEHFKIYEFPQRPSEILHASQRQPEEI